MPILKHLIVIGLTLSLVACSDEVTISTQVEGGGSFFPSKMTVDKNEPAIFSLTADDGYMLASVKGCDGERSGDVFQIASAKSDCAVVAKFTKPFTTEWEVRAGKSVVLATKEGFEYDFSVEWGDGTKDTSVTEDITHIYESDGNFRVKIAGEFPAAELCLNNETIELVDVVQFGEIGWKSTASMFKHCSRLEISAEDTPNLSQVSDMSSMFEKARYFIADLSQWDVSNVTNMANMFYATLYFDVDISNWNVGNVKDMSGMFYHAYQFNSDLSRWDVSSVTNMSGMFSRATAFNSDLSSWDVSSVTNMSEMFLSADSFNGDLSNWNVSSVTDMREMFSCIDFLSYCSSEFNSDLSNWNVSSVTNMSKMFTVRMSLLATFLDGT